MPTMTMKLNAEARKIMRFFVLWPNRPWADREISALCCSFDPRYASEYIDSLILLGRLVVCGWRKNRETGIPERLVRLNGGGR